MVCLLSVSGLILLSVRMAVFGEAGERALDLHPGTLILVLPLLLNQASDLREKPGF